MKQSLYQIESKYIALLSEIEAMEGELTEENEELLKINEGERDGKSIAYLSIKAKKKGENILIDEELKRLQAIKKANNNTIERLDSNLLVAVNLYGAFEVGLTKFGIRKSKRLEVYDADKIDAEFMTTKTTITPNKSEITKAIKNGQFVDGVELIECNNLKIN